MSGARYLSVVETARLLRPALKSAFPGVTFSVRSSSYAGGASIRVTWTDGPRVEAVKEVTGRYSGATFDAMIDLKSNHTSLLSKPDGTVETVHFGADYVFAERDMSERAEKAVEPEVREFYGEGWDLLPGYERSRLSRKFWWQTDEVDGRFVLNPADDYLTARYDFDARARAMNLFSMTV